MHNKFTLLRQQLNFSLSNFDIAYIVVDFLQNLLISLIVVIQANIAKYLAIVFLDPIFDVLLKLLFILIDVVDKEGLDFDVSNNLLEIHLPYF